MYFTPLAPGFHKEFEHENSCCHGTGLESHFKYADMVYAHEGQKLYVNLFLKSRLEWKDAGITIRQMTEMEHPEQWCWKWRAERSFRWLFVFRDGAGKKEDYGLTGRSRIRCLWNPDTFV